jgi:hypothetical protein
LTHRSHVRAIPAPAHKLKNNKNLQIIGKRHAVFAEYFISLWQTYKNEIMRHHLNQQEMIWLLQWLLAKYDLSTKDITKEIL